MKPTIRHTCPNCKIQFNSVSSVCESCRIDTSNKKEIMEKTHITMDELYICFNALPTEFAEEALGQFDRLNGSMKASKLDLINREIKPPINLSLLAAVVLLGVTWANSNRSISSTLWHELYLRFKTNRISWEDIVRSSIRSETSIGTPFNQDAIIEMAQEKIALSIINKKRKIRLNQ